MFFMAKIHILVNLLIINNWENVNYSYTVLSYCITGSISFNLIPNIPIFVPYLSFFHKELEKKLKEEFSSKPDFYDAHGDEKPFYWPEMYLFDRNRKIETKNRDNRN